MSVTFMRWQIKANDMRNFLGAMIREMNRIMQYFPHDVPPIECECDEISNGETCVKCGPSPERHPSFSLKAGDIISCPVIKRRKKFFLFGRVVEIKTGNKLFIITKTNNNYQPYEARKAIWSDINAPL